jgi:hypothetical protein
MTLPSDGKIMVFSDAEPTANQELWVEDDGGRYWLFR